MLDPERLLDRLNPPQRQAVTHGAGPLLILAGAGSGKTRVITCRIAYLAGTGQAEPREIVAMTFTNKAAGEMRERAEALLGGELKGAFLGTFHAFGLRLLRRHAEVAGLPPNFVIYDTADQLALVRAAIKDAGLDEKLMPPRQVLSAISRLKNALIDPAQAEAEARYPNHKFIARCYRSYDESLHRAGSLDFDDLLVQPVRVLTGDAALRERYAQRIRWLLVDEYQDTNPLQYRLIKLLSGAHRNVCCVGDEDQSIYGFRGADIRNILEFSEDFPDATVVKLEQNYRSTGNILKAASTVIANNVGRHEKTLWTDGPAGDRVRVHTAPDDRAEADFIVQELLRQARENGVPLEDMAVLYRTNALSRLIEDRLVAQNVPYRVYGSLRFYERKEIKDLLAWLRLLVHPDSDQDFVRAAGTPPRGLGDRTLDDLAARAAANGSSLHAAAAVLAGPGTDVPARVQRTLATYLELIRDLADLARGVSTVAALQAVIDTLEYMDFLEKAYPADYQPRQENIGALLAAAREHDEAGAENGLAGFLDRVSLRSDTDDVQGGKGPTLMTVHSAKGLEFGVVVVAGLNEELFPHALSAAPDEIEEERRLMYVALTRAKRSLALTLARERRPFGRPVAALPSRFLGELPAEVVRETGGGAWDAPPAARGPSWNRHGVRDWNNDAPARPAGAPYRAAGVPAAPGPRRVERDDDESVTFRPGMAVVHPMFGPGRVLSVEGEGQRTKLQIRFDRAGLKKIMPHATTLLPG